MRRAGWKVWMAYDLPGSYEEMPPNLLDELKRDRRWCQGNLINSRLFLWQGLHPAHRAVFMTGVMAYVSAPLWFLSLALSTAFIVLQTVIGPQYFVEPRQLFPLWPEWDVESAIGLRRRRRRVVLLLPEDPRCGARRDAEGADRFGGVLRGSAQPADGARVLRAARPDPHALPYAVRAAGAHRPWGPLEESAARGRRDDVARGDPPPRLHTLFGVAWAAGVYWLEPSYAWWLLLPVVGALALSIPLSVYSSRVALGRRCAAQAAVDSRGDGPAGGAPRRAHAHAAGMALPGFIDAVVDPGVNATACAASVPPCGCPRVRSCAAIGPSRRPSRAGPSALTDGQKLFFLKDPVALAQLHFEVWTSPAAHASWQDARLRNGPRDDARARHAS